MPRHLISDAHEWINEIPAVQAIKILSLGEVPELRERGSP